MGGPRVFGAPPDGVAVVSRPAAYAIVRDADGRIAVVEEESGTFLPGGGREADETAEQNVVREVREEAGCGFRIRHRVAEAVQYCRAHDRDGWYATEATFFAGDFEGTPDTAVAWLSAAEAQARLHHASHAWAVTLSD